MVENVKVVQVTKIPKSLNKILSQFFQHCWQLKHFGYFTGNYVCIYFRAYVSFSLTVSIKFRNKLFSFIIFVLNNQFNVFDLNFRP
jgi:hypothetical protein